MAIMADALREQAGVTCPRETCREIQPAVLDQLVDSAPRHAKGTAPTAKGTSEAIEASGE